jgi:hypothetical protein
VNSAGIIALGEYCESREEQNKKRKKSKCRAMMDWQREPPEIGLSVA